MTGRLVASLSLSHKLLQIFIKAARSCSTYLKICSFTKIKMTATFCHVPPVKYNKVNLKYKLLLSQINILFAFHCASTFSCPVRSLSFEAEKSELEIYFPELHVSMFAANLITRSYLRSIDFKPRRGLLTAHSPFEGGGEGVGAQDRHQT